MSNPKVIYRGAAYRVCYGKRFMLSKCLYCAFNCDRQRLPLFLRCADNIYFKKIKAEK